MPRAPSALAPAGDAEPPPGRAARALLFALAFAPAALCASLVADHAVNVPVWDDWERGRLVQKWQDGTLDLGFLYSPHIDHRILLPRLVALANAKWLGGDLRLEMGLAYGVVLGTALAAHALLRRTLGPRPGLLYGTSFLANLLLFTPLQWENFLWAAQPFFLLPMGALVLVLLVLGSRLSIRARFGICLATALVTSHTFSHGLVLWPVVFAFVVLRREFGSPRERALFLAAWSAAAAAVLIPYFTVGGFRNTSLPGHAFGLETGERVPRVALADALADPLRVVRFFFGLLGSVTARLPYLVTARAALWAGVGIAALFLAPLVLWLRRWRDAGAWDRWLPWVTLGGVALGLCALAAIGRTAMKGWEYSILPHYISISLYVHLAAVALVALAVRALRGARPPGPLPAAAAGLATALLAWGWGVGAAGMDEWRSGRLQARTSLLYVEHVKPRQRWRLDGSIEVVREMGVILDRHGLLDPPLVSDLGLARFELRDKALPRGDGRIERAVVEPAHGRVVITGFAWLGARRADGVLLVIRGDDSERRVLTVAELQGLPVVHIAAHEHAFNFVNLPGAEDFAAFEGRLLPQQLPDGAELEIEAFAVDAERMRLTPLAERVRAQRDGERISLEVLHPPGGEEEE
jgi:hypothetical protein